MKEIKLTQGYVALVDDEDYERVNQFKWHATVDRRKDGTTKNVYVGRTVRNVDGTRAPQFLHNFILKAKGIDHEDHNGLNCQKYNLRLATARQNSGNRQLSATNSSNYKGVTWDKSKSKWLSKIIVNARTIFLGRFSDPLAAAYAYDEAAVKYFGEFAYTNGDIATAAIETAA